MPAGGAADPGLLQGRDGWQAGTQDGERYWYFGVDGAGRLVITPKTDGFLMYRADQDRSWVIPRIELVKKWLDQNGAEHAGPPAKEVEFREALERARKGRKGPDSHADT